MLSPELTFFVIFSTWADQHKVSSIIRPSDLVVLTFLIYVPLTQIEGSWTIWPSRLLLPITMNSVFLLFKVNLLADIQVETFIKSVLRFSKITLID